ncbi:hypothetical protein ACFSZS_30835 [Seohaeicola zhoushanensis]
MTKNINLGAPGGVFMGLGAANVNRDVWQGLSAEQRAGMLKAAMTLSADAVFAYLEDDAEGMAAAKEKGVEIAEGDESLLKATADFVEKDVATVAAQFTDQFKVQNVDQKIETFRGLVDKWKGLTADIGEDKAKLADLYWTEIGSKVDAATLGMD